MDEARKAGNIYLSSPTWLSYAIAGGTVMFFGFAVLSLFAFEESGPVVVVAIAAFFSYMTYRGAVLCRFLGAELELDGSILRLKRGDVTEQFPLTGVRFKFEDWIQVVSVYDFSGDLVFAIDYVGQDIESLKQATMNDDQPAENDR